MKRVGCLSLLSVLLVACATSAATTTTAMNLSIPDATLIYYNITGSTANELRGQLDAFGPVGYDGYKGDSTTQWSITWHWPSNADGYCQLSATVVSYEIEVILPRWEPPLEATVDLRAKWDKYIAALAGHEAGHVELVLAHVPNVENAVKGAACDTANAAGEMVLSEIRKQDADYDRITDHGATQGARFR